MVHVDDGSEPSNVTCHGKLAWSVAEVFNSCAENVTELGVSQN